MGLIGDRQVPIEAKWAYFASHYSNLRWNFKPNAGYDILKRIIGKRDYFVLTSNVDACFERAGFDPSKIYTPQGDAAFYQCLRCCRPDSVFESKPLFDKLLETIDVKKGRVDSNLTPCCLHCNGPVFMNLRGGGWFLHTKYDEQNVKFIEWVEKHLDSNKNIVVVEVGVGFNTPIITRFPVESIIREASTSSSSTSSLIRINPADCDTPIDLPRSIGLKTGWEILSKIEEKMIDLSKTYTNKEAEDAEEGKGVDHNKAMQESEANYLAARAQESATRPVARVKGDWRQMVSQLHS